jgi:sterol desaturase/sphingolipid hydroxylase (fatty acid hydroxylase superfamily)
METGEYSGVTDLLLTPLTRLASEDMQTHWLGYLTALWCVFFFYIWSRRHRSIRGRSLLRYLFPVKLWRHPSSALDLKLYLFGSFWLIFQGSVLFGGLHFSAWITAGLQQAFPLEAPWVLFAGLLFLAIELGYWFGHYLMHVTPWLWEFHKVHHSAEVLTPLSEWRQHPVELIFVPFFIILFEACVAGVLGWGFGDQARIQAYWYLGIALLFMSATLLHLRHTHVEIAATGWLGRLIQSPVHHQIHHSIAPEHYDKNLGLFLSVWDWAFGTLFIPEKGKKVEVGLTEKPQNRHALGENLFGPFRDAAAILRGKKG